MSGIGRVCDRCYRADAGKSEKRGGEVMKDVIGALLVVAVAALWVKEFIAWRKRRAKKDD